VQCLAIRSSTAISADALLVIGFSCSNGWPRACFGHRIHFHWITNGQLYIHAKRTADHDRLMQRTDAVLGADFQYAIQGCFQRDFLRGLTAAKTHASQLLIAMGSL
jgi:hypothetical protein